MVWSFGHKDGPMKCFTRRKEREKMAPDGFNRTGEFQGASAWTCGTGDVCGDGTSTNVTIKLEIYYTTEPIKQRGAKRLITYYLHSKRPRTFVPIRSVQKQRYVQGNGYTKYYHSTGASAYG